MSWLILLALGCGAGEDSATSTDTLPERDTVLKIDCLGMLRDADGAFGEAARSRTWAYNEATESRQSRCFFQWPDGVEGSTELPAMRGSDITSAMGAGKPFANMSFTWGDATYNTDGGTVTFDQFEDGKASGTYRVSAVTLGTGPNPGVLPPAIIEGRFDWCDVTRDDCPHRAEIDGLSKTFEAQAPATDPAEGQTVFCRILHDEAQEAVRIDMQFATWNGINTAELYVDACSPSGGAQPQGNEFALQAVGIDGPGTYDLGAPRPAYTASGETLLINDFRWSLPAVLESDIPGYQVCSSYLAQMGVSQSKEVDGNCVLDLQTDRFELTCDTARNTGLGFSNQETADGAFRLASDCDWVVR